MARIVEFDLLDALAPHVPPWVTAPVVGVACATLTAMLREAIDLVAPDAAAPFAFIFPAIMLSTLVARWQSGAITAVLTIGTAWYFLIPPKGSFAFVDASGQATIFAISSAAAVTLLIAETFRRAVRNAASERDRQIADRDLFLEEFDHRVKNNFAIVASLLEMQRRRADAPTADALTAALMRIESIARAHRHLYRGGQQLGSVEMSDYLDELCTALRDALVLGADIELVSHADKAALPRDRAVSIGLVVNELVTNAAKHAFPGRRSGMIKVRFASRPGGWRLTVADNGVGMPAEPKQPSTDGGLGTRLIDAFARQAGGSISIASNAGGTEVIFDIAA